MRMYQQLNRLRQRQMTICTYQSSHRKKVLSISHDEYVSLGQNISINWLDLENKITSINIFGLKMLFFTPTQERFPRQTYIWRWDQMMMLLLLMCLPQIHSFFHPVFMSFIRICVHLRYTVLFSFSSCHWGAVCFIVSYIHAWSR